ncbi:hypothetical protein PAMC26510_21365 [Caballeronia sordidicola]|uniref:Uncharacterized protein n=2 Tax=Caballeronia sordidicola TaxID=196367 RepID=A0A242MM30_CABSO|nr:hypothetical protein PAMC26510_21365 [Caballeronia sordidicola]
MNEYLVALWESPNGKPQKLQRKLVKKFKRVEFDGFRLPYFFKMKKR